MRAAAALGAALLLSSVLLLQAAQQVSKSCFLYWRLYVPQIITSCITVQAEVRRIQEVTPKPPAGADSSIDTLAAVQQLVHLLQDDGAQVRHVKAF